MKKNIFKTTCTDVLNVDLPILNFYSVFINFKNVTNRVRLKLE